MLWLDPDPDAMPMEQILRQVAALAAVAGELDETLVVLGVGGLEGLVALADRLHAVLDAVTTTDVGRCTAEIDRLRTALEHQGRHLAALRELKALLDAITDPPTDAGDR